MCLDCIHVARVWTAAVGVKYYLNITLFGSLLLSNTHVPEEKYNIRVGLEQYGLDHILNFDGIHGKGESNVNRMNAISALW